MPLTDQERIARLEFIVEMLIERLPAHQALTIEQAAELLGVLNDDDLLSVPAYRRRKR